MRIIAVIFLISLCAAAQTKIPQASNFAISWGAATNGLRAGIGLSWIRDEGEQPECVAIVYVGGTGTNSVKIGLPPRAERFQLRLRDSQRKSVPQRWFSEELARKVTPVTKLNHLKGRHKWAIIYPDPEPPLNAGGISIRETFRISEPGMYSLSGQIVVFQVNDKDDLKPIFLDVKTLIEMP